MPGAPWCRVCHCRRSRERSCLGGCEAVGRGTPPGAGHPVPGPFAVRWRRDQPTAGPGGHASATITGLARDSLGAPGGGRCPPQDAPPGPWAHQRMGPDLALDPPLVDLQRSGVAGALIWTPGPLNCRASADLTPFFQRWWAGSWGFSCLDTRPQQRPPPPPPSGAFGHHVGHDQTCHQRLPVQTRSDGAGSY